MNIVLILKSGLTLAKVRTPIQPSSFTKKKDLSGFTLLEMIVVIAIIGILASVSIPSYFKILEKAKITTAISELGTLEKEILIWKSNNESLPSGLEEINRGDLLDPWGNPYQYLSFAAIKGKGKGEMRKDHMKVPINESFDLYSMGRDGQTASPLTAKASRDDIIRANNGQYIGLASEY